MFFDNSKFSSLTNQPKPTLLFGIRKITASSGVEPNGLSFKSLLMANGQNQLEFTLDGDKYVTTSDKKGRFRESKYLSQFTKPIEEGNQASEKRQAEIAQAQNQLGHHQLIQANINSAIQWLSMPIAANHQASQMLMPPGIVHIWNDVHEDLRKNGASIHQNTQSINQLTQSEAIWNNESKKHWEKIKTVFGHLADQEYGNQYGQALNHNPAKALKFLKESEMSHSDDLSEPIPYRLNEIQGNVDWFGDTHLGAVRRAKIIARDLRDNLLADKRKMMPKSSLRMGLKGVQEERYDTAKRHPQNRPFSDGQKQDLEAELQKLNSDFKLGKQEILRQANLRPRDKKRQIKELRAGKHSSQIAILNEYAQKRLQGLPETERQRLELDLHSLRHEHKAKRQELQKIAQEQRDSAMRGKVHGVGRAYVFATDGRFVTGNKQSAHEIVGFAKEQTYDVDEKAALKRLEEDKRVKMNQLKDSLMPLSQEQKQGRQSELDEAKINFERNIHDVNRQNLERHARLLKIDEFKTQWRQERQNINKKYADLRRRDLTDKQTQGLEQGLESLKQEYNLRRRELRTEADDIVRERRGDVLHQYEAQRASFKKIDSPLPSLEIAEKKRRWFDRININPKGSQKAKS